MKIARRKRAQAGTGCFNPGDAKSASRTRLNSSFQRAIFERAQRPSVTVPPPSKGPAESGPEGGPEGVPPSLRLDTLAVSVPKHPTGLGVDAVGLGVGGDGGNGRHDRPPLSAQGKGDFRPKR